ncbi:hypothetical protein [Chryseobacterium sp. CH21]|uniref:hypothetical protein n=1 Tax=Chryseobacterium sp. CH21 TaxID=713556 RepID=UPI001E46E820|nr:hypothetical protein [Chryseobacterium sp. CH21]
MKNTLSIFILMSAAFFAKLHAQDLFSYAKNDQVAELVQFKSDLNQKMIRDTPLLY